MTRKFPYLTVKDILAALDTAGIKISRSTFYRLEKIGLFSSVKTIGGWRRYSPTEEKTIIHLVKYNYGLVNEAL